MSWYARFPEAQRRLCAAKAIREPKALLDYAEQKGLVYVWAYTRHERVVSPAFISAGRRDRK